MDEQTELLRELVDLLRLIAEPAIAKRDEKQRAALKAIVGRSLPKIRAVQLMDGMRTQAMIGKGAAIDKGALSRLLTALREANLLANSDKALKLNISLSTNFLEE